MLGHAIWAVLLTLAALVPSISAQDEDRITINNYEKWDRAVEIAILSLKILESDLAKCSVAE